MQRKMGLENGFHQNGCVMKMLKTQGSKEIFIEMDEGRLRRLEKCFLWEEMVNSVNGGSEIYGRWSKKRKEKQRQGSGGPKFRPPHWNSTKS